MQPQHPQPNDQASIVLHLLTGGSVRVQTKAHTVQYSKEAWDRASNNSILLIRPHGDAYAVWNRGGYEVVASHQITLV